MYPGRDDLSPRCSAHLFFFTWTDFFFFLRNEMRYQGKALTADRSLGQ